MSTSPEFATIAAARHAGKPAVEILIDGRPVVAEEGEWLVDAILRKNAAFPHVCYHDQLGPIQTCDTCMVEIDGKLVRACATPVQQGMRVESESSRATRAQREAYDLILGNHMLYCTVCDNNNENCTVHNTAANLKVEHQKHPFKPKPYDCDTSNPFYRYDPDQCILCGRCVEACQNLQVNETLSINWESAHPRVLWDGGHEIAGSSCVSCGHCVTVCPCNALMEKSMIGHAGYLTALPKQALDKMIDVVKGLEPEMGYGPIMAVSETEAAMRDVRVKKSKTVCTYCGVGCSFDVWTKDRHILKVEPAHGAANGVSTCVKGKFGWDYVNSEDRLRTPLIRVGNDFREATWEEALTLVASKITSIKQEHGPDAIGVIASSKCTNEESYLMQKFARQVIGTNNVDNCSRYCQSPATQGLFRTVGHGGDSGSIHDLELASLVLIIGSNTAESHPVLATRIKRAHKKHGQRLIVADLRKHEMAERADIFFQPKPSTDLIWLSAMSRYMLDNGLANQQFLDQWVNGLDAYRKSLEPFTMEYASRMCELSLDTLHRVAKEIAAAPSVCVCWAMGVTQHCGGSDTSTAISNLLLITGNYMRPGTGAYPLRGHNNVQGASDFGSMPNYFPGYEKIADQEPREKYQKAWGVKIKPEKGLDNHEMIDSIYDGKLHMMYLAGEDMISSDADANRVAGGFEKLDFFVVQDIFFTETCRYADVVFPAVPSLEREGTFTNTERRIQRLYQVLPTYADSKPDWQIVQLLANKLGAGWDYHHPADVMHEAASLAPLFAGVTYDRLAGYNTLQWPVHVDGTDTPTLYLDEGGFNFPDKKARLFPMDWIEPSEVINDEFDIHLNNGRVLEHFQTGNQTTRVPGIKEINPERYLEMSPELAEERKITSGQWVEITSRVGKIKVKALVTTRVSGKEVYLPLTSQSGPVNVLVGPAVDRETNTPAYKETSVSIRVLPEKGDNPLKPTNFRFSGSRTPQAGVEVERKWKRSDYRLPGTAELVQINTAK